MQALKNHFNGGPCAEYSVDINGFNGDANRQKFQISVFTLGHLNNKEYDQGRFCAGIP
jgi:hypothetical protein